MGGAEEIYLGTSETKEILKVQHSPAVRHSCTAGRRSPRELESGAETKQPPSGGRGQTPEDKKRIKAHLVSLDMGAAHSVCPFPQLWLQSLNTPCAQ